jgi:hypothetical protein
MISASKNRHALTAALLSVGTIVLLWAFSGAFVSPQARECSRLYRAARTAADTVVVDTTVVASPHGTREPRSCSSFSVAARWFARR